MKKTLKAVVILSTLLLGSAALAEGADSSTLAQAQRVQPAQPGQGIRGQTPQLPLCPPSQRLTQRDPHHHARQAACQPLNQNNAGRAQPGSQAGQMPPVMHPVRQQANMNGRNMQQNMQQPVQPAGQAAMRQAGRPAQVTPQAQQNVTARIDALLARITDAKATAYLTDAKALAQAGNLRAAQGLYQAALAIINGVPGK